MRLILFLSLMVLTSCVSTKSTEVVLDGSGSSGPIVRYRWRQIKGKQTIIPNSDKVVTRTFVLGGAYHFELTGWDAFGQFDRDTLIVVDGAISPLVKHQSKR